MKVALLVPIALLGLSAQAQNGIHACDAEPAIQQIYEQHRSSPDRVDVLREALRAHPDDLFLNRWLILTPGFRRGIFEAEYRARFEAHPGEPLFQYLYGLALMGADTPQAIRLIGQALAKDPGIPYAYQALVAIYSSPNFRDRAKVASNLQAFTARCPQDVDAYSYLKEVDDPRVLREMTVKFRDTVENGYTAGVAATYANLWAAEFRIADPKTRDQLRERVRADIERIRELDPNNIDDSKSLIEGYRLLGDQAAAGALQAKRTPARTFNEVFQEWDKAHPYSRDPKTRAQSQEDMYQASAQWVKDWPRDTNAWNWRLVAVARRQGSSAEEIEKAGEDVLASDAQTFRGWTDFPYPMSVAESWEQHDIRLKECVGLLRQAMAQLDGSSSSYDDLIPPTTPAAVDSPHNLAVTRFRIWSAESQAQLKLKDFDAARSLAAQMKTWIDQHPDESEWPAKVWHDQAGALAEAEGHKPDALMHYQQGAQGSQTRASARALWTGMGGTPQGFDAWFKPPQLPKNPIAAYAVPWTAKDQPLTSFHARDLDGKTWTVADLQGKKTLITVWATWCQPCREELPLVQKFYEQTKDRRDIQVISISVDDDAGLLDPFMKAQKYTFPVLPATTFIDDISANLAIPRTWIVDTNGVLREEGIGFSKADWPDPILSRLNAIQ